VTGDQHRQLRRYLRLVRARSPRYGDVLATTAGARAAAPDGGLPDIPLTTLADVDDPSAFVLRTESSGGVRRPARRGRGERRFQPVHWVVQEGVPIGSSDADLDRLAAIGSGWLGLAGVQEADAIVSVLPAGPNLGHWQLVLGARQAGVSAVHLAGPASPARVFSFGPTVLAGRPLDLARLVEAARAEGRPVGEVHTLLAVGEPLEAGLRARLAGLLGAPDAAVVSAWAPAGVRALWGECRRGHGLHTWPDSEVIEIVDPLSGTPVGPGADGEVVWNPLGWHGTVFVRLRTGVFATLVLGPCRSCGWGGPRLVVSSSVPSFLAALDHDSRVSDWQAELRVVDGREELVVFLAPAPGESLEDLLGQLDEQLSATQYVVLERTALDARLAAHGDRRVLDRRV
jgi:hypothetical protein